MSASQRAVFSDIDGTLVHYVHHTDAKIDLEPSDNEPAALKCCVPDACTEVIATPISSTGLRGYISVPTIHLVNAIRSSGARFVLISGARTSTILERLPFLPAADAVVTENGGRIFMADAPWATNTRLREDMEWRATHAPVAGPASQESTDPEDRKGPLWDCFRTFKEQGFSLDTRSYSTCFRVSVPKSAEGSEKEELQSKLEKELSGLPDGLTSTLNLGKADVYPATSGKHQAVKYLMRKFGVDPGNAVALCDDDNDILMAQAVSRAYLPSVTSESMEEAVQKDPSRYVPATKPFVFGAEEVVTKLAQDWNVKLPRHEMASNEREPALA